jgi:hypothetical protein
MGDKLPSMTRPPEPSGLVGIPQECFGEDAVLGDMLVVAGDDDGCQFALGLCCGTFFLASLALRPSPTFWLRRKEGTSGVLRS